MPIPLDPGAGGRSIGQDQLRTADMIVSTTEQFVSKAIRFGTQASVSHTALYVGGGQVVEAIGEGVVLHTLDVSLAHDTLAVAYRHPTLTAYQALRARDYVGLQIGRPYATAGALQSGVARLQRKFIKVNARVCLDDQGTTVTDSFFCSQLVFLAFEAAGAPLAQGVLAKDFTPADLVDLAPVLDYVGHLKAPV